MKTLAKEHQYVTLARSGANWSITANATGGSWRKDPTGNFFISSTYFDLAGLAMDGKTLFFEATGVQSVREPTVTTNPSPGDSMIVLDLMSTSPLTDEELITFSAYGNFAATTSQSLTWAQTVYARNQTWGITVDEGQLASMRLANEELFGSMQPTASDRIYSYRLLLPAQVSMDGLFIYSARHMLTAQAKTEEEFVYLMRLKKAYELQQSYDED